MNDLPQSVIEFAPSPAPGGSDECVCPSAVSASALAVRAQACAASSPTTIGVMQVGGVPVIIASTGRDIGIGVTGLVFAVLIIAFIVVPLFKGIGWMIGKFFQGIGMVVAHVFRFVAGVVGDTARAVGALVTAVVLVPMILGSVVIGRWSASAHYGRALQGELHAFGSNMFRVLIGHPARLLLLGGLTEGVERRLPQAFADAPGSDRPSKRAGTFDGYTIVGSLPTGGSGGKLYVAEPSKSKLAALARAGAGDAKQVVIKSFSLADGSTMPQIVRESRALEAARKLGLILDHELSDSRFYYVMPYVPGDSLAQVTKRLHALSGAQGLGDAQLGDALKYTSDLLGELDYYHRGGLWHKDVKPDNIIVASNTAHLVDLGLVTPLRSAMTLTTHGTEYFRDPELVRMALRGAKVNEVDGVKFDIYGAGAVLYSVVENSFPAHGALSQVTRRCPEALRWVIRRSMADMGQRYASAAQMLADVRAIAASASPFAMKPIDLPSMKEGGMDAAAMPIEPPAYANMAPVNMVPPPIPEWARQGAGAQVGAGAVAVGAGMAGAGAGVAGGAVGAGVQRAGPLRPRLAITDWWRGKYETGPANAPAGTGVQSPEQVGRLRRAGSPVVSLPRSAGEQLSAARGRVRAAQSRIASRGVGSFPGVGPRMKFTGRYRNGPNGGVFVAMGVLAFVLFIVFGTRHHVSSTQRTAQANEPAINVDGVDPDVMQQVASERGAAVDEEGDSAASDSADNEDWSVGVVRSKQTGGPTVSVAGADQFEKKLNAFVADLESRVSAHAKERPVTARDFGAAVGETVKAWLAGDGREQASTSATLAPSVTPPLPPSVVSPSTDAAAAPGANMPAVVVASYLPTQAHDGRSDRLEKVSAKLSAQGYQVVGLGNAGADIDAAAAVKNVISVSGPDDPDAVGRLRAWMASGHAGAATPTPHAVLWVPADAKASWKLVTPTDLGKDEQLKLARAVE